MKKSNERIAVLDIGSTKICCLIVSQNSQGQLTYIASGQYPSAGLRQGNVVDMIKLTQAISHAVTAAEKKAESSIEKIIVSITGGQPLSKTSNSLVPISHQQVTNQDIHRVLRQAYQYNENDREILHILPINFSVDTDHAIQDPRGMFGRKLGLQTHIITASQSATKNLYNCLQQSHLKPSEFVLAAYASGFSCLVEDEKELGVTLIDMGGGTTKIAIYTQNQLVFTHTLPIGGQHVTSDLAHGLSTPLSQAERLKILYGNAIASPTDDKDVLEISQIGENQDASQVYQIPKSILIGIIQPRVEEILELVKEVIEQKGLSSVAGRRVVLTGGASQMVNLPELASSILNKQVRVGIPHIPVDNLPKEMFNPSFSTCLGLVQYHLTPNHLMSFDLDQLRKEPQSFLGKIGYWIRENF